MLEGHDQMRGYRTVSSVGPSWRHTCRIRGCPTAPLLVEAVSCLVNGDSPALRWLPQRASLLVSSPP